MDAISFGKAGLQGWRGESRPDRGPACRPAFAPDGPPSAGAVGALFFALSVVYVMGTIKRLAART